MRPQWTFLMTCFVCLMLLAACGQAGGNASSPATATAAPAAPSPTSASPARGAAATATAPARQTPTVAAQAATATPDAKSITLGKPSTILSGTRNVVGVSATNTSDKIVAFKVSAKQKGEQKVGSAPQTSVLSMPPGATWTLTMIADEVAARHYDLLDLRVEGLYVVTQKEAVAAAAQVKAGQPTTAAAGKSVNATVEMKNENDRRVMFRLHVLFVKDGVVVGAGSSDTTLEPGQTRQVPLLIEGTVDGAQPQVQISNPSFI